MAWLLLGFTYSCKDKMMRFPFTSTLLVKSVDFPLCGATTLTTYFQSFDHYMKYYYNKPKCTLDKCLLDLGIHSIDFGIFLHQNNQFGQKLVNSMFIKIMFYGSTCIKQKTRRRKKRYIYTQNAQKNNKKTEELDLNSLTLV